LDYWILFPKSSRCGRFIRPFCEASLIALWKKKESTGKIEQKSDGLP
jgi:hypothetical protein